MPSVPPDFQAIADRFAAYQRSLGEDDAVRALVDRQRARLAAAPTRHRGWRRPLTVAACVATLVGIHALHFWLVG